MITASDLVERVQQPAELQLAQQIESREPRSKRGEPARLQVEADGRVAYDGRQHFALPRLVGVLAQRLGLLGLEFVEVLQDAFEVPYC